MPHLFGDPELKIASPATQDTLALTFSVFGSCTAITSTNSPTITVKVMNGTTQLDSQTAVNNQTNGTWEAFFSLPSGTNVPGTGSIVVTCAGMNGSSSITQLTIPGQNVLTIQAPKNGDVFSTWSVANANGTLSTPATGLHLYITYKGYQICLATAVAIDIEDGTWQQPLQSLVPNQAAGSNYGFHAVVFNDSTRILRMSSGFFSVTTGNG